MLCGLFIKRNNGDKHGDQLDRQLVTANPLAILSLRDIAS